jgi:hypothetical protein
MKMSGRGVVIVVLFACLGAVAVPAQSVEEYSRSRDQITLRAMGVLAGWSAINLLAGTTLSFVTDDPVLRGFHQMNAGWNLVNAGLAIPGLISSAGRLASPPESDLAASLQQQNSIEDVLLFNAGIDIAYMMSGLYLIERSRRGEPGAGQLEGFGYSLLLQGGFLFVFDLVVYFVQRSNFSRVEPLL